MAWPETMPEPAAREFCKRVLVDGEKRCFLGWVGEAFYGDPRTWKGKDEALPEYKEFINALKKNCGGGENSKLAHLNDGFTLTKLARVWRKTIRQFGYVV